MIEEDQDQGKTNLINIFTLLETEADATEGADHQEAGGVHPATDTGGGLTQETDIEEDLILHAETAEE